MSTQQPEFLSRDPRSPNATLDLRMCVGLGSMVKHKKKVGKNKQKAKGSSELDNPKYANKSLLFELIQKAADKESQRESQKLAKRMEVAKILAEKDAQREIKKEGKRNELEKVKKDYLESKRKKKQEAKRQRSKDKVVVEEKQPKKKVRFAF
ncbi:hypothetical protein BY458DRAFT_555932 [Sporodiniella umbellata]|nr:hypothetical protein BY458DRAFT_555932 [Sporodiniella umbellata]